ncbi:MAG: aldo/keto reductase, partial [Acidobacteria bacterium]|nr:aldo/keto reductase [Acidobacteriota bacterium]
MKKETKATSRRGFLRTAALTGAGLGTFALPSRADEPAASGSGAAKPADTPAEAQRVPRRPLGKTGESIPVLLMGCAQKFDEKYDKILHRAFKDGVDYLDTALVYADGMSHKTIAPFIKQVGERKKLWITSKGPGKAGSGPEAYVKELDTCLEQMQTSYVDLYFMHAVDDLNRLDPEYLKMGDALRKSGETRFFGFSCHDGNVAELMKKAAQVGGIDAIMFRYSFRQYGDLALNQAIDACKKAGIGLIAMKTQSSVPSDIEAVVGFKSKDFTLGQAKLKSVWADERIDAAVSHMDSVEKLRENVAAAKSPVKLSMEDFQQLRRIAVQTAAYHCTGCSQHCETKAGGDVRIADTLRGLIGNDTYRFTRGDGLDSIVDSGGLAGQHQLRRLGRTFVDPV